MNAADVRLLYEILCGLSLVVSAVAGVMDDGKTHASPLEQDDKVVNAQHKIERRTPWSSLYEKALGREKRREMDKRSKRELIREKSEIKVEKIIPGLEKDTDDPEGVVHTLGELRAMKPGAGVQWRDQMPIAGNGKGSELKRRKRREVGFNSNDRTNAMTSGASEKASRENRVSMRGKRDAKKTLKKKSALNRNVASQNLNNGISAWYNTEEARATSLTRRQRQAETSLRQGAISNKKEKSELKPNVAEGKEVVDSLVRSNIQQVLTSGLEERKLDDRKSVMRNRRYLRRDEDDESDNDDDEEDEDEEDDDDRRDRRKRHAKIERFTTDPDPSQAFRGRRQEDELPRASTQAGLRQLMKDVESIAVDDDLVFDAMSSPNLDTSPDNVPEMFDRKKLGTKRKKRRSTLLSGFKKTDQQSNDVLLQNRKLLQVEPSERAPGGSGDVHQTGIEVFRRKRSRQNDDDDDDDDNDDDGNNNNDDDDDDDDDDDENNQDGGRDRKKRETRKAKISSFKAQVNKTEVDNATKLGSRGNWTRHIERQLLEIVNNIKNGIEDTLKSLSGIKMEDAGKLLQNPTLRLKRQSDDDQDDEYLDGENDGDRRDYSERNHGNDEDGGNDEMDQDDDASSSDEGAEAVDDGEDGPGGRSYEKTVVKVSKVKSNPPLITAPPKDIGSQLVKLQEEEEKDMANVAPTLSPRKKILDSSLRELTAKLDKIEDDLKRKEAIQRAKISKRSYSRIQNGRPADNTDFGLSGATFDNKNLDAFSNEPSGSGNNEIIFADKSRESSSRLKRSTLSPEKFDTIKVGRLPKWMLKMNEIVAGINGDIVDMGAVKTIGYEMEDDAARQEGKSKSNFIGTLEKEESGRDRRENSRPINKFQKNMFNVPKGERVSEMVRKAGPAGEELPKAIEVSRTETSNRYDSQKEAMRKNSNANGGDSKSSTPGETGANAASRVASDSVSGPTDAQRVSRA